MPTAAAPTNVDGRGDELEGRARLVSVSRLALPMPRKKPLTELTADIVTAHVLNNPVSAGDLPRLIQEVHGALSSASSADQETQQKKPSARQLVSPDHLVCLVCGRRHTVLRRHLRTAHGMTPDEYRSVYDLPATYPMTAPEYAARRSQLAKAIGLGREQRRQSTGGRDDDPSKR